MPGSHRSPPRVRKQHPGCQRKGGGNLGWWASILKEGREGTSGREEGGVPCDSEPGHALGFPPSKAPWAVTPQTLLTEGSSPAQGSPSCLSFQLLPQNSQPMSSGSFLSSSHLPSKSLLAPRSSTPPHIAEILQAPTPSTQKAKPVPGTKHRSLDHQPFLPQT